MKHSRVREGKHLSDMLPINSGVKQDALSRLLLNFPLEYGISIVQKNQDGWKLNGTQTFILC
jgi:hypothetical protein